MDLDGEIEIVELCRALNDTPDWFLRGVEHRALLFRDPKIVKEATRRQWLYREKIKPAIADGLKVREETPRRAGEP